MDLKEARHTAGFLQGLVYMAKGKPIKLTDVELADTIESIIILCDRLTELEAQGRR